MDRRPTRQAAQASRAKFKEIELNSKEDETFSIESPEEIVSSSSSDSGIPQSRRGGRSSFAPKKYRKLSEFELLEAGIHDMKFWLECIERARPIKRGQRSKETAASMRPPVDILKVRLPEMNELKPLSVPSAKNPSLSKDKLSIDLNSSITVNYNNAKIQVLEDTSMAISNDDEKIIFLNTGKNGVSSMDWSPVREGNGSAQYLAVANFPDFAFSDPITDTCEDPNNTPIKIYKFDSSILNFVMVGSIRRTDDVFCRKIQWYPKMLETLDGLGLYYAFAGIFSDGKVLCWTIREDLLSSNFILTESNAVVISSNDSSGESDGDSTAIATTISWSDNFLGIGYSTGHIQLWKLPFKEKLQVGCLRPSSSPIYSIAFHHSDRLLTAYGFHDSPAVLTDWRETSSKTIILPSLSLINLVKWSRCHSCWLMTDSESGAWGLSTDTFTNGQSTTVPGSNSFLVAIHPSPVSDMAISKWHNIIATAGFDGTVHLSWIDPDKRTILAQRSLLRTLAIDGSNFKVDFQVELVKHGKNPIKLGSIDSSISSLDWSKSPSSLGLLAISSFATGIVTIIPVDRHVLLHEHL